jgi:hypothetical protein
VWDDDGSALLTVSKKEHETPAETPLGPTQPHGHAPSKHAVRFPSIIQRADNVRRLPTDWNRLDEALFKEACDALAESLGSPLAIGFRIRLRKATALPTEPSQQLMPAQQHPQTYNVQHNMYVLTPPPPGHGMQWPPAGLQYHYPAVPGLRMVDQHATYQWPAPLPVIPQAVPAMPPHTPSATHSIRYEPHRPCHDFHGRH